MLGNCYDGDKSLNSDTANIVGIGTGVIEPHQSGFEQGIRKLICITLL